MAGTVRVPAKPPKTRALTRLWLIAHEPAWNEAGRDSDGRRISWLECPSKCNARMWGCDGNTPQAGPLHKRFPGRFGPWPVSYCPRRILAEPDPFVAYVLTIYRDWKSGNLTGWPDRYSNSVVEAVHYLDREIDTAQASVVRR